VVIHRLVEFRESSKPSLSEDPWRKKKGEKGKKSKTINSRYSLVVTHPTTNLPAHGLSTAERTGSPVFHVLWSIAEVKGFDAYICIHVYAISSTFAHTLIRIAQAWMLECLE
jgi:hypothetical protein